MKQDTVAPGSGQDRSRPDLLAELIRRHSSEGKLISGEQLQSEIDGMEVREDEGPSLHDDLNQAIRKNQDLRILYDANRQAFYHSVDFLSRTYDRILAFKGTPVLMMADTIRDNSARYPRPVPLDLFEQAPFDLAPETIQNSLREMANTSQYRDIAATTSSEGRVFLYSSDFLSHDYASQLAEWEDVGHLCDP